MAFLFDNQDEEDKRKAGMAPQVGGTGQGGPAAGQAAPQGSSGPSTQRQFVDINAYLDKNQEQTGQLADKVAGNINEAGTKLRGDISNAETDFNKRADEGSTSFDENFFKKAMDNPADFVKNSDDVNRFTRMRSLNYGGPHDITDVAADLPGRVKSETDRYKQDVDTSAGRKQFLQGLYPSSTPGMLTLDEALLGGNQEARAKLTGAASQFGTINQFLDDTTGRVKAKGEAAQAATDTARNTTTERLTGEQGVIPQYQKSLNERLQAAYTDADQRAAKAQDTLKGLQGTKSGQLNVDDQTLAELGMSREDLDKLRFNTRELKMAGKFFDPSAGGGMIGIPERPNPLNGEVSRYWQSGDPAYYNVDFDPTQFGTQRNAQASFGMNELAGADDYAKAAALAQLSGQQDLGFLSQANADKAGTANLDTYDFNGGGAGGAASAQLKEKDLALIREMMGSGNYGDPMVDSSINNYVNSNKPFFDAVSDGRVTYHSTNPEANARGLAGLRALARQGFYNLPSNQKIGSQIG